MLRILNGEKLPASVLKPSRKFLRPSVFVSLFIERYTSFEGRWGWRWFILIHYCPCLKKCEGTRGTFLYLLNYLFGGSTVYVNPFSHLWIEYVRQLGKTASRVLTKFWLPDNGNFLVAISNLLFCLSIPENKSSHPGFIL